MGMNHFLLSVILVSFANLYLINPSGNEFAYFVISCSNRISFLIYFVLFLIHADYILNCFQKMGKSITMACFKRATTVRADGGRIVQVVFPKIASTEQNVHERVHPQARRPKRLLQHHRPLRRAQRLVVPQVLAQKRVRQPAPAVPPVPAPALQHQHQWLAVAWLAVAQTIGISITTGKIRSRRLIQ